MRRIKILLFWLFSNRNNVTFTALIRFLLKPRVSKIADRHRRELRLSDGFYEVSFVGMEKILFWPSRFPVARLDQVIAETFDTDDWHYYQKTHTEVRVGERLLDIGTAEGLLPLTVVEKCDHVFMVEPGKTFQEALHKTFEPFREKVTIFHSAVGNMDGEIDFDDNSLDGTVSETGTGHTVAIHKIDTLMEGKGPITYLKADIEGFEEEMLRGAGETIRKYKPRIAITTYHDQNDPNEIISIIKGYVPEYRHYVKGIYEKSPKPVMIHFWI